FCATDRVVVAARRAGLDVIALPTYTPAWARPRGSTDKHPPDDPRAYGEFVRAAVTRYRAVGVRVWEVWNEPNIEPFWQPKPDPLAYGRVLAAGATAAHEVDPTTVVLTGGLAPAADAPDGSGVSPETFVRRLYDSGGLGGADGLAVHPRTY